MSFSSQLDSATPDGAKFLILSLPRSRSAWMAHFLSYGRRNVGHDLATYCGSIQEFLDNFSNVKGSCETGGMLAWKIIKQRLPTTKLIVVKRELKDVISSLERFGLQVDVAEMQARDVMLDRISSMEGTHTIWFDMLQDPTVCSWLFEYCLEEPFDSEWYSQLASLNIQIDMQAKLNQLYADREKLTALKSEIIAESKLLGGERWLGLN